MTSLNQLVLNILYQCRRTGDWEPEESNISIKNLLERLSTEPEFREFFSWDIAYELSIMELSRPELHENPNFDENDASQILSNIQLYLSANAAIHWLVIPLRGASLNENVRFKNFMFISGDRNDKIETLRRITQISRVEANSRAEHTENSRSPGFFDHPLLAIKVNHQTGYVDAIARRYALWAICSLQAIYWSYIYPDHRVIGVGIRRGCSHLAIYSRDRWRFRHQPLHFSAECKFNLDWISLRSKQRRFVELMDTIVINPLSSKLIYRFLRALRYFGKAIDAEDEKEFFEGMGINLLYLMIAAETVLLDQDFEKRIKLTVLLPQLARIKGHTQMECMSAIDKVYRFRSDFVHSGIDTYSDWDEYFKEGKNIRNSRLVKRMVAKLLTDSPKHIKKMLSNTGGDVNLIESEWMNFLKLIWNKRIGLN